MRLSPDCRRPLTDESRVIHHPNGRSYQFDLPERRFGPTSGLATIRTTSELGISSTQLRTLDLPAIQGPSDNENIPLVPSPCELLEPCVEIVPDRASYLVLQIGIPAQVRYLKGNRTDGPMQTRKETYRHLRRINVLLEAIGVTVGQLTVSLRAGATGPPRYVFSFLHHQRRDADARRLVEAFTCGLAIAGSPISQTEDPMVFLLSRELANRRSIGVKTLLGMEESSFIDDRLHLPNLHHFSALSISDEGSHELAWRIASITFKDVALFEATRFLHRSFECFFVWPGQIDEVAFDDTPPQSASVRSRYEDALHNSFKAIESIIGDPPKDDRRFSEKLKSIGINGDEEVGYRVKQPISAVIRSMSTARDKKSAHGSTRDRHIRPSELLEFQACARFVVVARLECSGVDFGST